MLNVPKMTRSMSQSNPSLNPAAIAALAKASFTPNATGYCHEHNHLLRPHMHSPSCDRFVSGVDKNRQQRFYFTQVPTPLRVYLSYNEKLITAPTDEAGFSEQLNPLLNGRKLSPKTLRSQLKISPQFVDEAKNFIFSKDTLSLVPTLPMINLTTTSSHLTMAEMAVQPLSLPPISQQQHHPKTKQNPRLISIKSQSRKLTESSVHSTTNLNTDRTLDDVITE